MFIVHGTFDIDSRSFRLWGETDTPSARKAGRRSKTIMHPFAIAADQLKDWLINLIPHAQPESQPFAVWLPSSEQRPQPSQEMRARGIFADDEALSNEVRLWHLEGVALSIPNTVDLLLALVHRGDIGHSLYFWRAAALEALALVAGQQVIPTLQKVGFRYHAFWKALPEQPERLIELAARMPPICRVLAEAPDTVPATYKLLETFVDTVLDSTIREAAANPNLSLGRGIGAAWLSALTTHDPQLKLPNPDSDALFNAWQTWAGQNDAAGNNAFRIAFRLDAPEDDNHQTWRLSYLLQATDDPSLIVPASQIWRGRGDRYLQQRFDQPQERLLRGLAFAGRLFTPILDSLKIADGLAAA